jgi:hypothetical protein
LFPVQPVQCALHADEGLARGVSLSPRRQYANELIIGRCNAARSACIDRAATCDIVADIIDLRRKLKPASSKAKARSAHGHWQSSVGATDTRTKSHSLKVIRGYPQLRRCSWKYEHQGKATAHVTF